MHRLLTVYRNRRKTSEISYLQFLSALANDLGLHLIVVRPSHTRQPSLGQRRELRKQSRCQVKRATRAAGAGVLDGGDLGDAAVGDGDGLAAEGIGVRVAVVLGGHHVLRKRDDHVAGGVGYAAGAEARGVVGQVAGKITAAAA